MPGHAGTDSANAPFGDLVGDGGSTVSSRDGGVELRDVGHPLQSRKRSRSRTRSPPQEHCGSEPREQEHREESLTDDCGQSIAQPRAGALDATQLRIRISSSSSVRELIGFHPHIVSVNMPNLCSCALLQLLKLLGKQTETGEVVAKSDVGNFVLAVLDRAAALAPLLNTHEMTEVMARAKKLGVLPRWEARDAIRERVLQLVAGPTCPAHQAVFFSRILQLWGVEPVPGLELAGMEGKAAAAGQLGGGDATKLPEITSHKMRMLLTSVSRLLSLRKHVVTFDAARVNIALGALRNLLAKQGEPLGVEGGEFVEAVLERTGELVLAGMKYRQCS